MSKGTPRPKPTPRAPSNKRKILLAAKAAKQKGDRR